MELGLSDSDSEELSDCVVSVDDDCVLVDSFRLE